MGSDANRLRKKWQDVSGRKATKAENSFYEVFQQLFKDTEYEVTKHPQDFKHIYLDVELAEQELNEIYTPDVEIKKHGISPDLSIKNTETNKTIYIEVKRQDGWVEGGKRKDGRGNAHERSNKFFTPGLLKILREKGNIDNDTLPFWVVFQGNITRDPLRVREITLWYDGLDAHYFFWRDNGNPNPLIEHFLTKIKPIIG
jgi:hypothetical protein